MAKYIYPAVFTKEENGKYSIDFPDLESCYTCGDDLADGFLMAEDVLSMVMYEYEKEHRSIPRPSNQNEIKTESNEAVYLIAGDTHKYERMYGNRPVRKNVTIPAWLDKKVSDANISLSAFLQQKLKEEFHLA